jgi:hypothetical protein
VGWVYNVIIGFVDIDKNLANEGLSAGVAFATNGEERPQE